MTPEREADLRALAARLGHEFRDLGLLDQALTHTSWSYERDLAGRHNEPLEFLGDAVLGLATAELLHHRDPLGREGNKSFMRAALISSRSLAPRAAALGLPALLRLGRGEEKTGGRKKQALWADALEAVLASLYLDGGLPAAARLVAQLFAEDLGPGGELELRDHKSALQEWLQGRGRALPDYEVQAEEGPAHQKRFRVACRVEGLLLAEGEGGSKRAAQQQAARLALAALQQQG